MKLPDHIPVSETVLRDIAQRYDVPATGPFRLLPESGIFNTHYALGPYLVLRVPRNHPEHFAALRREAVAVPAAWKAGVRTPELVAIDDSHELLPCPLAV